MVFVISGKIALVTGGASGIGLSSAKELLRQGLKGLTIADINEIAGKKAVEEIEKEFGTKKAVFIKTDVTKKEEFENAFKKTVEHFEYIDILLNNAGIMNDAIWEKEIDINLKGEVTGVILGLENYLKNHKQGREAVILNTSSIAGLFGQPLVPVYAATKFGVVGLTKCWGTPFHYERSNVRVVAVCPGITDTPIFQDKNALILPEYEQGWPVPVDEIGSTSGQELHHLAKEIVRIIKLAGNGSIYVVENGEPAYEFILPDRETFKENVLKERK